MTSILPSFFFPAVPEMLFLLRQNNSTPPEPPPPENTTRHIDTLQKSTIEEHAKNQAVALMLLGSMCFFMSLFYLVNHSVRNIQTKTWETISSTVSVFSAITIYQAVRSIIYFVLGLHGWGNIAFPYNNFGEDHGHGGDDDGDGGGLEEISLSRYALLCWLSVQMVNFLSTFGWQFLSIWVLGRAVKGYQEKGTARFLSGADYHDDDLRDEEPNDRSMEQEKTTKSLAPSTTVVGHGLPVFSSSRDVDDYHGGEQPLPLGWPSLVQSTTSRSPAPFDKSRSRWDQQPHPQTQNPPRVASSIASLHPPPLHHNLDPLPLPSRHIEESLRSRATLSSHICAFCGQDAFFTLQISLFQHSSTNSPYPLLFIILIFLFSSKIYFKVGRFFRGTVLTKVDSRFRDMTSDELDLYREASMDAHVDVAGIIGGLIFLNYFRFVSVGVWPDKDGLYEKLGTTNGVAQESLPFLIGVCGIGVPLIGGLFVAYVSDRVDDFFDSRLDKYTEEELFQRKSLLDTVCNSWEAMMCMFGVYAMAGGLALMLQRHEWNVTEDLEGVIVLALVQSAYALTLILVFDKIQSWFLQYACRGPRLSRISSSSSASTKRPAVNSAHAPCHFPSGHFHRLLQQLFLASGLLIGLGWERSFDKAIELVVINGESYTNLGSVGVKVVLSVVLTLIVLPAWRWYIIPKILDLEEEEEERVSVSQGVLLGEEVQRHRLEEPLLVG